MVIVDKIEHINCTRGRDLAMDLVAKPPTKETNINFAIILKKILNVQIKRWMKVKILKGCAGRKQKSFKRTSSSVLPCSR